jgi:hypothetical protein
MSMDESAGMSRLLSTVVGRSNPRRSLLRRLEQVF